VLSAVLLFLNQCSDKFGNAAHKILTTDNRKYVPAGIVAVGFNVAGRRNVVILVGFLQLFREIGGYGGLNIRQLFTGFSEVLNRRVLAFEMGF